MKKHNRKAVNGILLFAMCTLIAISTCRAAATSQNLTDLSVGNIQAYLKTTGQDGLLIDNDVEIPAAPDLLGWTDWETMYSSGGVSVQFMGQSLLVHLEFIRGVYDSYTKTYKAEPVVDFHSGSIMTSYIRSGKSEHYNFGVANVNAVFTGESVKLSNYANPSQQITVSYSDLLAKWASYASTYCAKHLDKRYCLVPQVIWNGSFKQYGWVATENTPLYYTTSMPQDYVDLFKQIPPNYVNQYRPIAYSLPLRLTFVLSTSQTNIWEIRRMTDEEAGDAMLDETKSKKNLFMPSLVNTTRSVITK